MTNHTVRLYTAAVALLAFFVLWAAIAAHPWRSASADPRLEALAQRERLLRREAVLVRQIVAQRAATAARAKQAAQARARYTAAQAQPSVRVVNLPPLVVTRTS
jgi:hypothetical protein